MDNVSIPEVINAAGKLTALGGSAQVMQVASAQADAASRNLDLTAYRQAAAAYIADLTGADAACVTTGAAAGLAISVAAVLTGTDPARIRSLPQVSGPNAVALQAGHAVNFGADITQMIRLGGGMPQLVGSTNAVSSALLDATLEGGDFAAYVHVISHHCVQENMTPFTDAITLCRTHGVPVIVDAAAEEDLNRYVDAGADLVTYSGGKAIAGPTSGFIVGRGDLIAGCEAQYEGIARTMKVGKEQIAGLLAALALYTSRDEAAVNAKLDDTNARLLAGLADLDPLKAELRQDEAGRELWRVALSGSFDARALVSHLAAGDLTCGIPPIRTRNHSLDQGLVLLDPRELKAEHIDLIVRAIRQFFDRANTSNA